MFRTFAKKFLPNPLDRILKKAKKRGAKKILLGWNRGLGDIPLGLYAVVHRIHTFIADADITFVTREDLKDGFSMLGVKTIISPDWKRGKSCKIDPELKKKYDLVIENPSPTDWVHWQIGKLIPKLKWDKENDTLFEKFGLSEHKIYIGMQVSVETSHGPWRNWPLEKWQELIDLLEKNSIQVLLFGFDKKLHFKNKNIVDLRSKTTLFELISIIKHRVYGLVLPDSGIASFIYYIDTPFPLKLVTLWADNQGIRKQNVSSPNLKLRHHPLVAKERDLSKITVPSVVEALFPCNKVGAIILAGGLGSRLGHSSPKGLFQIAGKTLFQWLLDKVAKEVPIAIMTSPDNHEEIVGYFQKNRNFGFTISFFQQDVTHLLDADKKKTERLVSNGNGSVFKSFVRAGLDKVFQEQGIEIVTLSNIENPLANPLDLGLIAMLGEAEVAIQCIEKEEQEHPMGAIVQTNGKVEIIEYTEQGPSFSYKYAYTGQMAFNFPFFKKMAKKELPIHWALKKMEGKNFWKGEKFLFDVLPEAKDVKLFCSQRKTCYAPVKDPSWVKKVEKILLDKAL